MDLKARAKEKEIDGTMFRCWPIPWDRMRPLASKLTKIAMSTGAAALRGEVTPEQAANGLDVLAQNLDDKLIAELAEALGNASEMNAGEDGGEKWIPLSAPNRNLYFAGRPMAFVGWLVFGMEANGFADFFAGMKSIVREVTAPPAAEPSATATPPTEPATST